MNERKSNSLLKNIAIFLLIAILSPCALSEQSIHALRSAYLYYFSHFITWPEKTIFPEEKLNICAYTEDPDDIFQLSTINNQSIGSLGIFIRTISDREEFKDSDIKSDIEGCHIVYFGQTSKNTFLKTTNNIFSKKLVVVTESQNNLNIDDKLIGDIHLFQKNNNLVFFIDSENLNKKGFLASSKLLRLSKAVTEQ